MFSVPKYLLVKTKIQINNISATDKEKKGEELPFKWSTAPQSKVDKKHQTIHISDASAHSQSSRQQDLREQNTKYSLHQ